jgi:predicted HTH transcriptional regulator
MRLRGRLVGQVTENELRALIDARVPESRTIEYKAALPGKADDEKREYLADVSAFANTAGGVIVYGMETERDARGGDTGVPKTLLGVGTMNTDQERLRLTQLAHDGLEPSLASQVAIQEVAVSAASGPVLLLGVSRGFSGPHMVSFQRSGKFWRRNEGGKYQPDVQELRRMFLETKAWTTEADEFRRLRIAMVLRREILPALNTS